MPPKKKKKKNDAAVSPEQLARREQDEQQSSDEDRLKTKPVLREYVDKKSLVEDDFATIQKKFTYSDQVMLFRQRSLRQLSENLQKKFPKSFTLQDRRKSARLAELPAKESKAIINKVRIDDAKQNEKQQVRRSARIRKQEEDSQAAGGNNKLPGLVGYNVSVELL